MRQITAKDSPLGHPLIAGAPFVHIHDSATKEYPNYRDLDVVSSHRTLLSVPPRKGEALLGMIVAGRFAIKPFSEEQIALLQNFAAQAVIAMENARLITETRQALDQQTATAEVLQVINTSPGNLAPVFDAMLEKAMRLCDAAHGRILTYDGESFHPAAVHGEPRLAEHWRQQPPFRPHETNPLARLVRGEGVIHAADAREDDAYRDAPEYRRVIDLGEIRTSLMVPLRRDDALLGAVRLYRQEVRPFSERQISLVENFAAQAVIAMENARLINETREALEQQTATAEVLQVINSSPGDLAPVFEAMLEKATRLCEAPFGTLRTWDGERFHFGAVYGDPQLSDWVRRRGSFHPDGGHSPLRRIIEGEQVVQVADASSDAGYSTSPAFREMVEASGMRSVITVALRKDEALVGTIHVYRQEVRPFTGKQIALLENFAAQAVIAMENARLITETREALEQQTATAEVLGVINSSPGNLVPVFDAILEKAHTLCEAEEGSLNAYDGEHFRAIATRGLSPEYAAMLRAPQSKPPGSPPDRLLRGETIVQVPDASVLPFPIAQAATAIESVRTILYVPLRKDTALLGYITVYRQEVRPFSDKQIALLQNFAAQAVIAMENARLINETREALEQQTATAEVLQVINSSSGDLLPVFDAILEKAHVLCGAAHGAIGTYDSDYYFRTIATRGYPEPLTERLRQGFAGLTNPVTRPLIDGCAFVHVSDLAEIDHPIPQAAAKLGGFQTGLFIPLRKDDALLGMFAATRREVRPFSDKQIALLESFAAQAVIAMENARLLSELRDRTAELARSVEELQLLSEVGQAVSSALDVRTVLSTILTRSVGMTGADAGAVFRYRLADRSFSLVEAFGWDEALLREVGDLRISENETAMGEAAERRAPFQIADLEQRPSGPLRDASLAPDTAPC
jgi:GAF domain-containing protein